MDERLQKQLDFALEIDKEKNIFRQTHLSGHGRNENDAEHAWHMAIMAYLLREYANERVNIERVMIMCLIHDIVEIDAGDTYAYDAEGLKTQKAREEAAKERIFSLLPDDQKKELSALFDEFGRWAWRIMGAAVTAGIGTVCNSLYDISISYEGAREAVSYRVLYGTKRAINIAEIVPKESKKAVPLEETRMQVIP